MLCKADTFAKVFPEPKEPYVVITANKKILNNGDKVKITVFLVNPTGVNVKIRCANLFREDGSPVDGIVGFSFLEDGKDFAVPRGKNSSYANIGDRPYHTIKPSSQIMDSFEWICDQSKSGVYTFTFSFHASPYTQESKIDLILNKGAK